MGGRDNCVNSFNRGEGVCWWVVFAKCESESLQVAFIFECFFDISFKVVESVFDTFYFGLDFGAGEGFGRHECVLVVGRGVACMNAWIFTSSVQLVN